jgi:trehalose 6-phosphate synthase/phosphatase
MGWKKICVEILNYVSDPGQRSFQAIELIAPSLQFTERTPGSFVDEREASVVWRFGPSTKDEGSRQWGKRAASEAQNHIWDSLGERFGEIGSWWVRRKLTNTSAHVFPSPPNHSRSH